MAIDNNLTDRIQDLNESWEGKSGKHIEDFISRKLKNVTITDMTYRDDILTITNEDGTKKTVEISAVEPTYSFGIMLYGIRLDGDTSKTYTEGNSLLMLYNSDRKVEVGIAMYAIQTTNSVTDRIGPFNVKITYGTQSGTYKVNNIKYEDCIIDSSTGNITGFKTSDISWIDVTNLFTKTLTGEVVTAAVVDDKGTAKDVMEGLPITTLVISLAYNEDIILSNNFVGFNLTGSNTSNYHLEGFNNGEAIKKTADGVLSYTNLTSGLNQLVIQAVHNTDSTIYTDYVFADVIYTKDCEDIVIAINGVSNGIANNDVATLYKLSVYNPKLNSVDSVKSVEISTYLESKMPNDLMSKPPKEIIKYEILGTASYEENGTYETSYKKYIEINSADSERYLVVKKDDSYYNFYNVYRSTSGEISVYKAEYKTMTIEAVNSDFVYYQDVTPNFNYDLIGGYLNNVFVTSEYATDLQPATVVDTLEFSDGWYEEGGRTIFKVSALQDPILVEPINLYLTNSFSIELGLKTYNISNESKPILTLGNLQVRPTQVCWWDSSMKEEDLTNPESDTFTTFNKRNAQFLENVETHIMICVLKGFNINKNDIYYPSFLQGSYQTQFDNAAPSTAFNLVRIFINGVIDREIELQDNELYNLINSTLLINPTTSDVDFYLFRVYNNSFLGFNEVQKNYISFLKNKEDKQKFFDHNNILGYNGEISFVKTLRKQNSLVYIYPKGARFPNRFWEPDSADGTLDNDLCKNSPVTLFINYADSDINQRFGGRLTKGQVKGQGSSAMRYLIWNVTYALNKFKEKAFDENGQPIMGNDGEQKENKIKSVFTPFSQLNTDTNRFVEGASSTKGSYIMPQYEGQVDKSEIKVTKLVGKVNFASSMQSHKIGACKLFDDAYKTAVTPKLPSGGRKAVHEEPYLYFYWETDLDNVDNVELSDLLANDESIKFMGFQTWGAGKGDDAESGYDEDITPEYLMLEGGENTDPTVNFRCPWQALQRATGEIGTASYKLSNAPTVTYAESLAAPWDKLLIEDESVVYLKRGAWDIDFGCEEVKEKGKLIYFKFADNVHESLKKFRAFYDFVYEHDCNYIVSTDTAPNNWDTTRKYLVTGTSFSIDGVAVTGHTTGDLYRYDDVTEKWVRAGVSYNQGWSKSNIYDITGVPRAAGPAAALIELKEICKTRLAEFVDINDIAFHQAFIKFLSGTDNRAKNTYYQIIGNIMEEDSEGNFVKNGGGDYLIRLIGDDLDTILVTDNNGLQSKPYNLVEDSYEPAHTKHWGDANNVFLKMFDQNYESDIKDMLAKILEMARITATNVNMNTHYFYNAFFSVQENFPAVAYNHTAKIYYENAQAILNSKVSSLYQNNAIAPLEQSHGSCLACERQFLSKRMGFLSGYALTQLGDLFDTAASAGSGGELRLRMEFEPYQDFYPAYMWDSNYYLGTFEDSEYDTIKHLVKAGENYTVELSPTSTAINQGLYQPTLYKRLNITGLKRPSLDPDYSRMVEFKIDNNELDNYRSFFGESYPKLSLSSVTANFPVLEKLTLNNMSLQEELDFSTYYKLKDLDLTGTNVKYVIFPQTNRLTNITLPDTIDTFKIYNNTGLKTIKFLGIHNLNTIYIDCAKCGEFDVSEFLEKIASNSNVKSITLENANLSITEETLEVLLYKETCIIEGTINIITEAGADELKGISFKTKKLLVEKFGNIDDVNNVVFVNYKKEYAKASDISCLEQVNVFFSVDHTTGNELKPNPFVLNISGNNIVVNNNTLHIQYSVSDNDYINVDKVTGDVTLKLESEREKIPVTITVYYVTQNGDIRNTELECSVIPAWIEPRVGDYMYHDATYSPVYTDSKTLIGIVFAVNHDSSSHSGTAYILGKEYSSTNAYYSGLPSLQESSDANKSLISSLQTNSDNLDLVQTTSIPSDYTSDPYELYKSANSIDFDNFKGFENTKIIVNKVNALVNNKFSELENVAYDDESESYYISDLGFLTSNNNLKPLKLILYRNLDLSDSNQLYTSVFYPYFYSAYLYEPKIEDGYTLNKLFQLGNWYIPSLPEMNTILIQLRMSYSTPFNDKSNFDLASEAYNIKPWPELTTKGCYKSLLWTGRDIPSQLWTLTESNWVNINNITSTSGISSRGDSYTCYDFMAFRKSTYSKNTEYAWTIGNYYSSQWSNNEIRSMRAYKLLERNGIPCVQYKYSKNSKL